MTTSEPGKPQKGLSRRQFLGNVAVGAAAVSGAGLLGGVSNAFAADDALTWDRQADVVIMGFGAAGSAAAIEARAAGASTIVLEQTSAGGGATKMSGGLMYMGGGTPLQKKLGVTDTRDDMYNYLMAALGPGRAPTISRSSATNPLSCTTGSRASGRPSPRSSTRVPIVTAPPDVGLIYSGNERGSDSTAVAKAAPRGHSPTGGSGGSIWAPRGGSRRLGRRGRVRGRGQEPYPGRLRTRHRCHGDDRRSERIHQGKARRGPDCGRLYPQRRHGRRHMPGRSGEGGATRLRPPITAPASSWVSGSAPQCEARTSASSTRRSTWSARGSRRASWSTIGACE